MGFLSKFFSTEALFPTVNKALLCDKTVLGVVSSATQQQVLRMTFEPYQCNVTMFDNAQKALNSLETLSPDVAIVDSAVTDIPSLDICRLVKERHPQAALCLMKGFIAKSPNPEERQAGVRIIIEKAFDSKRLLFQVADALNEKRQTGA